MREAGTDQPGPWERTAKPLGSFTRKRTTTSLARPKMPPAGDSSYPPSAFSSKHLSGIGNDGVALYARDAKPASSKKRTRPSTASGGREGKAVWGAIVVSSASDPTLVPLPERSDTPDTSTSGLRTSSLRTKPSLPGSILSAHSPIEHIREPVRVRTSQTHDAVEDSTRRQADSLGPEHVPYPRSNETTLLDYDDWNTLFLTQLVGSITSNSFDAPPGRVLDLGCGTGTWVCQCAGAWPDTHFVGMDVILPPADLCTPDSSAKLQWVQGNFLEPLPFGDAEFDFVHVSRIGCGMRKGKWDEFLQEIGRVLKPGGALEIMEEDLFFPGTGRQLDYSGPPSRPPSPPAPSAGTSVSKNPSELTVEQIIELAEASWDMSASLGVPGAGFISAASLSMNSAKAIPAPAPKAPEPPPAMEDLLPEDPRDHSLLEAIYDGMHAERVISLRPLAALEESLPRHFKDVRTHEPIVISVAPKHPVPGHSVPGDLAASADAFFADEEVEEIALPSSASTRPSFSSDGSATVVSSSSAETAHQAPSLPAVDSPLLHDERLTRMHLALRVAEVRACAESMWVWVSAAEVPASASMAPNIRTRIAQLTRKHFDILMHNFVFDMQDYIGMPDMISASLGWSQFADVPSQQRKEYDAACEAWDARVALDPSLRKEESKSSNRLARRLRVFCAWKAELK